LLHPAMPFLTEELWHKLPQPAGARSIALDKFPEPLPNWADAGSDDAMARLQEIVIAARNIRAEMKIDPKRKVAAEFSGRSPMLRNLVLDNLDPLLRLAALSELRVTADHLDPAGAAIRSTAAFDLRIAFSDAVDKPAEIARLKKDKERLEKDIASKQARLADESFTSKAPGHVVDALRFTMLDRQLELRKILDRLRQLEA
jgi:valyl-tRNA synthetase